VVVRVLADIVEIIVLATRADTLLRVASALQLPHGGPGIHGSKKNRLELVHASIGEEQRRVVHRNNRRGGNERVLLGLEKFNERLTHFVTRPRNNRRLHLHKFSNPQNLKKKKKENHLHLSVQNRKKA